jgi:hypothetical protein
MAGTYQPNCVHTSGGSSPRPQAAFRRLVLLAGLALAPATGCVTLDVLCPAEKPPVGMPCRLATTWEPGLRQAFDPYHGGAPYNALAGRLYLLDSSGEHLLTYDGEVKVELFDDRPTAVGGAPVCLERWDFPSPVVKLLCRKNAYGWGYSIALPWITSYRPDITQVHLRVCYTPVGGAPMYIESDTIRLAQDSLVLPQGFAQPSGLKPTTPSAPISPPTTLRLERQPPGAASLHVPGPAAVPVQAPAPAAAPTAERTAEAMPDMPPPIVMTLRRQAPPPAQAVEPAVNQVPANITFDTGSQGQAQLVRQAAAQAPASTAGPAAQPGWAGMAK